MKREIKFRGMNDIQGVWYYGDLLQYGTCSPLITNQTTMQKVKIDTIGQYTGMKDKNGNEIYEGDILNIEFHCEIDGREVCCEPYIGVVTYDVEKCCFSIVRKLYNGKILESFDCFESRDFNVIGNKYDNPELIKED